MAQELKQARDELAKAAKTADDDALRDDIREQIDAFEKYTQGDQEPDHAVLDEQLNQMRQLSQQASADTKDHIEQALETAEDYREGIEQA